MAPLRNSAHPMWNSLRINDDQRSIVNSGLLRLKKEIERTEPHHSGFPPGAKEFCLKHLKSMVRDDPFYKTQVEAMVAKLQENMAKVQKERDQLDQAFGLRLEAMAQELEELFSTLPEQESSDALPVVFS
jgi:hypothetical protein